MLKIMGIICIITTGTYIGHKASRALKNRVKQLENIISFLQMMTTQIRYTMPTMDIMFDQFKENTLARTIYFPQECANNMRKGDKFPDAWKSALDLVPSQLDIKKTDLFPLYELGEQLGCTDVDGQLAILSLTIRKMDNILEEAREEQKRNGNLYRTLGLLCGIFVVIFIV